MDLDLILYFLNIPWVFLLWTTFLKSFIFLNLTIIVVSVTVFAERKVSAFIQDRVGPNRVGIPFTLIGGKKDCFSCEVAGGPNPPLSFKAWQKVTWLNVRHQEFAWFSLFSVAFTDVYIRYISMSGCGDLFTILF
jgi:hypothetical protein